MSTTNSVELVFHNGQTATEPLPVYDRDDIKSMKFRLGCSSVVLSTTSPSAVEVVVHQLDQQPPPASGNITDPVAPGLMISPDNTRNLIMIVATLLLQMAYQAGLNPPGGFWPDDLSAAAARSSAIAASSLAPAPLGGENGGDAMVPHQAGDPILRSKHRSVYLRFEWLNALSLSCSSLLILILMAPSFVRSRKWSERGLWVATRIMYLDLLIILLAYNAGAVNPDNRNISLIPYSVVAAALAYTGLVLAYWTWIRWYALRQISKLLMGGLTGGFL